MKLLLKKEKGVSEVIGTLLILAITVTLFSSVFYYVSTIPTPTPQVYSSFSYNYNINTNSTMDLTVTNTGGQALMLSSTQLMLVFQNNKGTKVITHMLSEKNFSSQINSSYFGVGKSFTYHSWWDNVSGITYLTTIYVYLIDKQNSQIVWYTVLQGSLPTVKVVGFSYLPSPLKANSTQSVTFNAFVIYNQNNKVLPNVNLTIVGVVKSLKLIYSSPMTFTGNTVLNLKTGIYTVYVNATLNNTQSSYKSVINVVSGYSSNILKVTSITFTNPNPVHGSNDGITVTVYSTSPNTETFRLYYNDTFRGNTIPMQISTGNPSPYFTIAPFTSMIITATWLNIGGSGAAAGLHTITVNIALSPNSPPVTVQGLSTNITVLPKILLVDDENVPVNSPSSVFNFYTSMFLYIDYPVDTEIIGYNQLASTSGYDLVIWITGYSSQGLSQNQANQIISLANSGVSILFISSSPSSYSYLSSSGWFQYTYTSLNNGSIYFTKIGNYNININGTLTPSSYGNNVIYFYSSSFKTLSYYKNNVNVTGIYSTLSSGAKVVIIGFEFSRLYVYQQDIIMNKIMLWLSNITIRTGNDLALLDMRISNPNPLFSQPVNLTFYVANFSPVNLTNIDLEVLIDNQPINGQPLYHINFIPGNGSYVTVNVTWTAGSPGPHTIYAYVNPYHTITEVNYNNNGLPPVVLNVINVRFSTLVVWIHGSNDKNNNITSVTSALSNMGVSYVFLNYYVGSNQNPPNLTNPASKFYFMNYNLVILDFNSTAYSLDSNLANAIISYLTNKNITKFPYSLLFLGEYAGYAINSNTTIKNYLYLNNIVLTPITGNVKFNTYLFGNNTNAQNLNLGFFGTNITRGYGLVYKFNNEITTLSCTYPYSMNILINSSKSYGVLENISNLMVGIIPLSIENIVGIIQNHTTNTPYSPSSSSSSILTYSPPSSARYTQNLFMLNLLLSFKYAINKPIPEILSCDINVSSQYVTLNNYYLINGIVRNLGFVGVNIILQSYEEQSLFSTQSIYLPPVSAVKFQVLWKPNYASSPSPEILRFVLVGNFQKLPMQEALIFQKVYFLYNNGSTLQNWKHYNVLQYISGEPLFGLSGYVYSDIQTNWYNVNFYRNDRTSINYGWTTNDYFSYPYSYYIQDVIDWNGTSQGKYASVSLKLAPVTVSPGEIVTLSWEWKYSIAMAQNGLFLMVQIGNTWYQVALPYNSNPDLGNILTINGCKIVEVYNGQSGGGTFSWTYHSINTNELYVMDPNTGLPMPNPINVTGQKLTFMFVYIAPAYYASSSAGSSQPGAGIYIDNVMLSATNGGNDGWRVIHPGETSNQYGISTNGISYLGFQGAPTYSLIALYNNYQGYPTFANSLWDHLITPVIDLYNAINATLSFTFKANIAQGLYGAGWPGDYFSVSVSTNGGSTWSQVYSPPTYPSGGQYGNGGQSGGGTIYATDSSHFYPANGANSTYWLTITINLNFYLGLPIYIDFSMVTNNGWNGYSNIFIPWHAVGYNNANANPFFGLYLTNIYVQGYSQSPPISYSGVWT